MEADVQTAEPERAEAPEAYNRAMHGALRLLAAREHSVQELRGRLCACSQRQGVRAHAHSPRLVRARHQR